MWFKNRRAKFRKQQRNKALADKSDKEEDGNDKDDKPSEAGDQEQRCLDDCSPPVQTTTELDDEDKCERLIAGEEEIKVTSDSESEGEHEEEKDKKDTPVAPSEDKGETQTDIEKTEADKPLGSPLVISTDDQRSTKSASSPSQTIYHGPMHSK